MGMSGPRDVSFDAAESAGELRASRNSGREPWRRRAQRHARALRRRRHRGGARLHRPRARRRTARPSAGDGSASGELSVPPRALLAGRAGLQAPLSAHNIDVALESGEAQAAGARAMSPSTPRESSTARSRSASPAPRRSPPSSPRCRRSGRRSATPSPAAIFAFGQPATLDGEPASELTWRSSAARRRSARSRSRCRACRSSSVSIRRAGGRNRAPPSPGPPR